MPYPCNPCDCPEAYYRESLSWRKAVIELLCGVEEAVNAIGIFIPSGPAKAVLFLDASEHIGYDVDNFNYDKSTHTLNLTGPITYGAPATTNSILEIRGTRAPNSDDGIVRIIAGGAYSNGRGGYLELRGENATSSAGDTFLNASGNMYLQGSNADSVIYMRPNAVAMLAFVKDFSFKTIAANESTGGNTVVLTNCPGTAGQPPFTWIKIQTSDNSTAYVPCWK